MAEGNCLYERLKQQVSFDGGQTWQDTGVYSTGNLIERDSPSCGYITEYVFVIPGVGREASTSVTSGASTVTYQITSTKNDSPIGYGIVAPEWCTVTSSSTGISISVDVNDTGTDRFGTVYLVQDESGIMIMIDIDQDSEENPPYVFTFDDGYTSKTASISEQGGGMMYQVISTYNGQTQSYSLSSAPAWATVDVSGNNVRVVVGENTGVTRSGVVTLVQSGSNKTITISLSQASSVPYVFTFSNGEEIETVNAVASGGTYSLGVISTHGSDNVSFSVTSASQWFQTSISNGTLYVTIPSNTGSIRDGYIELTQAESNYTIYVSISQAALPPYTFTFSNGQTYTSTTAVAAGGRYCYQVVSTQDGNDVPYGVYNAPEWTEIEVTGNSACVTVSSNTSSARTGIVTLQQSGSSKTIQINLSQQSGTTPVITGDYLTAIFLEDGEFFTDRDDVSYSVNGAPWSSIESYSLSQTFPAGTIVKYKCTKSNGSLTPRLIFSKKVNVSGYPASMIYGDDFMEHLDSVPDKGFYRMFSPCHRTYNYMTGDYCWYCSFSIRSNNIVDASGIRLPATTVGEYAYYQMFEGNPYLTAAPAISATTLDDYCYWDMFKNCTSLTTAPALPATALTTGCYWGMFENCSSLTTAPSILPATILNDNCYQYMFKDCTSLTTAPVISATTLATYCCYAMFQGCTSLTTAPVLSASTLVLNCYVRMFYGCSNLTGITCMATGDTDGNFYFQVWEDGHYRWRGHTDGWVYGVSPSGIFTKNAGTQIVEPTNQKGWWKDVELARGSGIPPGWIVADNGEYLFTLSNGETSAYGTSLTSGGALTYGIVSVYMGSGVQYTASSSTEWLTTSIVGSSLTITIAANPAYNMRNGVVTLKQSQSNKTITINVEQMQDIPPEYDYLTFEAIDNDFSISCQQACSYRVNDGQWISLAANTSTESVNPGDCIRVVGNADLTNLNGSDNFLFSASGRFNLMGCPASMTHGHDYETYMTVVAQEEFHYMFSRLQVVDASGIRLPATTLATRCYYCMFEYCESLTKAPELPATTLAEACYAFMFSRCTRLTAAPAILPATTLADHCYSSMFNECTHLATAPELPATTLAPYCYSNMFHDCTSLTTAPELPATTLDEFCYHMMFASCYYLTTAPELPAPTLANWCYQYMFAGCRNLNYIKCLATDISAYQCTNSWVYNVAATGTFVKAAGMNDWTTGANGIPSGWTIVDNA